MLAVPPDEVARTAGAVRRARTSRRPSSARSRRPAGCELRYHGQRGRRPRHALPARRPARRGAEAPSGAPRKPQDATSRVRRPRPHSGRAAGDPRRTTPSARKEWIIRQYDHEVQGGSVVKPLVGVDERRPVRRGRGDAGARLVDRGSRSAAASTRGTATSTRTAMAAARHRRGGAQRRRRRRRPDARSRSSTTSAGATSTDPSARRAGPRRRGVPRRGPRLRHAVHQRQGQPQQRVRRAGRRAASPSRRRCWSSALGRVPDVRQCVTMDLKEAGQRPVPRRHDDATNSAARTSTSSPGATGGTVPTVDLAAGPEDVRGGARGDHGRAGAGVPRPERRRAGGRRWRRWRSPAASGPTSPALPGRRAARRREAVQRIADAVRGRGEAGTRGGVRGVLRGRAGRAGRRRPSPNRGCGSPGPTASGWSGRSWRAEGSVAEAAAVVSV